MTIEEMKKRKIELGLTGEMIAKASGVPLGTVQKIFSGATKAPRKATIDALIKVLEKRPEEAYGEDRFNRHGRMEQSGQSHRMEQSGWSDRSVRTDLPGRSGQSYRTDGFHPEPAPYYMESVGLYGDTGNRAYMKAQAGAVKEPVGNYSAVPKHGAYTIADYYSLPDDQRVELIDGEFYDMGAPSLRHQRLIFLLQLLFEECIEQHGGPCEVFAAPCDVRLDRDNYTMVQPDLLVICGDFDRHGIRYEGPPELVVEVLSDSTRSKDLFLKLYKYQNAGVKEYWIVDPKKQTVTVHYFDTEEYDPKRYDFQSEIPINISKGECRIDFSRILDRMSGYF